MWCAADNNNYMCHICAKGILDSNFNYAVINKISNYQAYLKRDRPTASTMQSL